MKTVLLAGGKSSRMLNAGQSLPKSVIPIGNRPVIWHIMRSLAGRSDEFVIALGHHQDVVSERLLQSAVESERGEEGSTRLAFTDGETCWRATLVDTGDGTRTAGRVKRLASYLDETFICAWSDGLNDANIDAMLDFHRQHGRLVTALAVRPPERFGRMMIGERGNVIHFTEKQANRGEWINGGFFIVEPGALEYIHGDDDSWEYDVLPTLAEQGQLMAWRHEGFWQCMDYPHEVVELDALWEQGNAPWKNWND